GNELHWFLLFFWFGLINDFNKKLGADDFGDADALASADGFAVGRARGSGVARAALNVGNFAHAIFRDGRDDGSGVADQRGHTRFAGAFGFPEHRVKQPEHQKRDDDARQGGKRRADPVAARGRNTLQNQSARSERRHKRSHHRGTEKGNARHAALVQTRPQCKQERQTGFRRAASYFTLI